MKVDYDLVLLQTTIGARNKNNDLGILLGLDILQHIKLNNMVYCKFHKIVHFIYGSSSDLCVPVK